MKRANYVQVLLKSFADFFRDGGLQLAGSISYFSMMAIVPFGLFLITIIGYLMGNNAEFYRFFSSKLFVYFPDITYEVTNELKRIIIYHGIGIYSLLLYGLISYQLFSSLETAIHTIFRIKKKRSFIVSVSLSLFIVTIIIASILLSFIATSFTPLLKASRWRLPGIEIGKAAGILIQYVAPLFLAFLIMMVLYYFLPSKRVKLVHAAASSFLTSLFLESAKHLFAVYVIHITRLGTIYGPLSAFAIFMLWVFYSSCIFLIGAEVVRNLGDTRRRRSD
jgi:membrane protein